MRNLQSNIDRDCSLILEAIRRLKEGTWQLNQEDSDWTEYLMPRVREALMDHIRYEDACILHNLPNELARKHSAEHNRIIALLDALDSFRRAKNLSNFHAFLELLTNTLEQHHNNFSCRIHNLDLCNESSAKDRIIKRSENSSLEYK